MYVIINLSKPTECTTPRMNPNRTADFGWWWCAVTAPSVVANVPLWWGTLAVEKAVCVRAGRMREIPVPSVRFCCEPKGAQKKKKSLLRKKKEESHHCDCSPVNKGEDRERRRGWRGSKAPDRALQTCWTTVFVAVGAVLCTAGCSASRASTHWMPAAHSPCHPSPRPDSQTLPTVP